MKTYLITIILIITVIFGSSILGYVIGNAVAFMSNYLYHEITTPKAHLTVYGFTGIGFIMGLIISIQLLSKIKK